MPLTLAAPNRRNTDGTMGYSIGFIVWVRSAHMRIPIRATLICATAEIVRGFPEDQATDGHHSRPRWPSNAKARAGTKQVGGHRPMSVSPGGWRCFVSSRRPTPRCRPSRKASDAAVGHLSDRSLARCRGSEQRPNCRVGRSLSCRSSIYMQCRETTLEPPPSPSFRNRESRRISKIWRP